MLKSWLLAGRKRLCGPVPGSEWVTSAQAYGNFLPEVNRCGLDLVSPCQVSKVQRGPCSGYVTLLGHGTL